ncbi:MAG: hypothetical protein VW169_08155 [Rhodospirillaceae bacterium]
MPSQPVPQVAPQAASAPPAAAQPAPPATAPKPSGSVQDQSRVLAETVVNTFTDRLKIEARKRGGYLTVDDINRLTHEFESKRADLEKIFEMSFDQYVRARERAAFDHARQYPFDRLIVNSFAGLFVPDRVSDDGDACVTRAVLPGFFIAMDKMLGPETIEEFQAKCRTAVGRLSKGNENDFNWEQLYADKEAQMICLDALIAFLPYFEDLVKRMDWFVPLVNGAVAADVDWELTEPGFYNLVAEMFLPLRTALGDTEDRIALEKRKGAVALYELDRLFEKIDKVLEFVEY